MSVNRQNRRGEIHAHNVDSPQKYRVLPPASPSAPIRVVDPKGRLHLRLSQFANSLANEITTPAFSTIKDHVRAIAPLLSAHPEIASLPPEDVRALIIEHLIDRLGCECRSRDFGIVVSCSPAGRSHVQKFLSGVRQYFDFEIGQGNYPYPNPLLQVSLSANHDGKNANGHRYDPSHYFFVKSQEWIPQAITDPSLPSKILAAGEAWGWKLREQTIVRLLFSSGARISELCALNLRDWATYRYGQKFSSPDKGSNGKRVKILLVSPQCVRLLQCYFDEERVAHDPNGWTLADYRARAEAIDLDSVPIFLNSRSNQLDEDSWRDMYWRPAMKSGGLHVTPHQLRHWAVTARMAWAHEHADNQGDIERFRAGLVNYMGWRSGEQMLDAYDHFLARELTEAQLAQFNEDLDLMLSNAESGVSQPLAPWQPVRPDDEEADPAIARIWAKGGSSHAV
jgi:integrase